jgi:hypothetical protein
MIYGLFLPDDVLEKIYLKNAERIFFGQRDVSEEPASKVMKVKRTEDFVVNGKGNAPAWRKTDWVPLNLRNIRPE